MVSRGFVYTLPFTLLSLQLWLAVYRAEGGIRARWGVVALPAWVLLLAWLAWLISKTSLYFTWRRDKGSVPISEVEDGWILLFSAIFWTASASVAVTWVAYLDAFCDAPPSRIFRAAFVVDILAVVAAFFAATYMDWAARPARQRGSRDTRADIDAPIPFLEHDD